MHAHMHAPALHDHSPLHQPHSLGVPPFRQPLHGSPPTADLLEVRVQIQPHHPGTLVEGLPGTVVKATAQGGEVTVAVDDGEEAMAS